VDEARYHYSNATREASWLERYLDAVRVALEASKRPLLHRRQPPTCRPASWVRLLLCLVVPLVACHSQSSSDPPFFSSLALEE
jgi:hypothetical protein